MINKIFVWVGHVFDLLADFAIPLTIGDHTYHVSYLTLFIACLSVLFFVNLFWKGARA